jgi:hypothetical protein
MSARFAIVGDLLFSQLDAVGAPLTASVGFRLSDCPNDLWSRRFNLFKSRRRKSVKAGARTLVHALRNLDFNGRVVVVGAISSGDRKLALRSPVDRLGKKLAKKKGWEWRPDLLSKKPHRSLHTIVGARNRDRTVAGVYRASRMEGPMGLFVIVDDFCTRGATLADIRRALLKNNTGWSTFGVTLAKTDHRSYSGALNDHVPADLDMVWNG